MLHYVTVLVLVYLYLCVVLVLEPVLVLGLVLVRMQVLVIMSDKCCYKLCYIYRIMYNIKKDTGTSNN